MPDRGTSPSNIIWGLFEKVTEMASAPVPTAGQIASDLSTPSSSRDDEDDE